MRTQTHKLQTCKYYRTTCDRDVIYRDDLYVVAAAKDLFQYQSINSIKSSQNYYLGIRTV